MFSDVFASFLGKPIEFPWPESCYTIARVSEDDLGFHEIGKIGPQDQYHCIRNDVSNQTMVLDVIYIMYAVFLVLPGPVASSKSRR